jgi:hypothetical protein
MGVLYARVPPGPTGTWVPIKGGGGGAGISQDDADLRYVNLAGDTMTGQLTMRAGQGLVFATVGDGAHLGFYDDTGNNRRGFLQGYANGVNLSADVGNLQLLSASGRVLFPANVNVGVPAVYGAAYGGLSWSSGHYLIMSDGGNTFVSTPSASGTVFIRGGANGAGIHVDSAGNLTVNNHGGTVLCETVEAGWTGIWFGSNRASGWYIDGSSGWIRSRNNYGVWVNTGKLGTDGGLSVGFGGGGNDAGHIADINGYMRVTQRIDAGGFNTGGDSTFGPNNSFGYINTRNGYRITSNGSWSGFWANAGFVNQGNIGGEARTNYSMNTSGYYALQIGITTGGGMGVWNADASYCDQVSASSFNVAPSLRSMKQDVRSWPAKSVGSAAQGATSRLSLIDVVEFRHLKDKALMMPDGTTHDCDTALCDGTSEEPCERVRDWENPHLGFVIEDLITVLPEAVALTPLGEGTGVRVGTILGFLMAVCKEQQERIEALEQQQQEAA